MASRVRDKLLLKETRRGDVARVAELIRAGTDVNKLGKHGMTALMCAAYYGHESVVGVLVVAFAAGSATGGAACAGTSAAFSGTGALPTASAHLPKT
jgi:hypothetical protein